MQKSLTLYVQLSAYPRRLFALPIFGPTKCQEFFIKGFFISYLLRAAEVAICPSGGRRKLGMVLSFALQASCCSLIHGQSSFWRCPQFLLWSGPLHAGCCSSSALRLSIWHIDLHTHPCRSYPGLSGPPFPRVIIKKKPLIMWWSPPTDPQVKCAALLRSCLCIFELRTS